MKRPYTQKQNEREPPRGLEPTVKVVVSMAKCPHPGKTSWLKGVRPRGLHTRTGSWKGPLFRQEGFTRSLVEAGGQQDQESDRTG